MYEFDPEWLAKLDALRSSGVDPYPSGLHVTHTAAELHGAYNGVEVFDDRPESKRVCLGGRLMFKNDMGKALFLRIQDRSGAIQLYVKKDVVGEVAFAAAKGLDVGDVVWARGDMMRTRTKELTLACQEMRLAAKILTPFPDRWHAVTDVETRARQRYVDLFINPATRDVFVTRSRVVSYVRRYFEAREFLEVETPMLQTIPGGAVARPFVTHHNALDIDLYLRIAPELFLKRLVVGGIERVFEVNRNFRNEGISVKHNPEFTMLEFYWAWATHDDLMDLTEDLLAGLVRDVCGGTTPPFGEAVIDWTAPFRRAPMGGLIAEKTGLSRADLEEPAAMEAFWRSKHPVKEGEALPDTRGRWWEWLFDEYVEASLVNPTFVTAFPAEISPLSRRNDADPSIVDRFELYIAGREIANGFSELNDPVDQAARFEAQAKARDAGDAESMYFDHDYVRALSYAMPPTAGEGVGIDRLVMLLTGQTSIREVILFPTLRPGVTPGGS